MQPGRDLVYDGRRNLQSLQGLHIPLANARAWSRRNLACASSESPFLLRRALRQPNQLCNPLLGFNRTVLNRLSRRGCHNSAFVRSGHSIFIATCVIGSLILSEFPGIRIKLDHQTSLENTEARRMIAWTVEIWCTWLPNTVIYPVNC